MATINTRNVPDDLYHRVRLAAACGAPRIPKGAMERFVIRALRRAVDDPRPGFGLPKLKLCARCVAVNQEIASAPKSTVAALSQHETGFGVDIETTAPNMKMGPFAHLLNKV